MRRQRGLLVDLCVGVTLAALSCSEPAQLAGSQAAPEPRAERPNLLYILLDDAGYGDFGDPERAAAIRTPHLDRLAASGTIFTQSYANAPVCSPSRAAILTGHHPVRYGIRRGLGRTHRGLPAEVLTLPELLQREGYVTAHIGKWHLGMRKPEYLPDAQGFDHSVLRARKGLGKAGGSYFDPAVRIDGKETIQHEGHLTEILTDYAIRFVREHRDERFFLNLWYKAPHGPIGLPEVWAHEFPDTGEGRYAALVGFSDFQIGRLLAVLDELGIAEKTLVVVTSDNGGVTTGSRTLLRGGKAEVFEGGIRVPLVVRWPQIMAEAQRNDSVVAGFDVFPTVAEILGLDTSALGLQGESFLDAMEHNTLKSRRAPLFWENKEFIGALSMPAGSLNTYAVRKGAFKLVHAREQTQLFDLSTDPGERQDLSRSHPAILAELAQDYRDWRLTAPRIHYEVARTSGAVKPAGDDFPFEGWTFEGAGRVSLVPNTLFDFNDGDFTFVARVALEAGAPASSGDVVIARKRESWELRVNSERRVELTVQQDEAKVLELESRRPLHPGRETQVAFSVLGFKTSESVIRLYIDGDREAAAMDLRAVRASDATIEFGAEDGSPFQGTLRDVRLYLASLSREELAALW